LRFIKTLCLIFITRLTVKFPDLISIIHNLSNVVTLIYIILAVIFVTYTEYKIAKKFKYELSSQDYKKMKKTKTLSLFAVTILAFIFAIGLTSAQLAFSTPTSNHPRNALTVNSDVTVVLTNGDDAQEVVLTLEGEQQFANPNDVKIKAIDDEGNIIDEVPGNNDLDLGVLGVNEVVTVVVSMNAANQGIKIFSSFDATLTATAPNGPDQPADATITHFDSFCRSGPISAFQGNIHILEIDKVDIENRGTSDGDDDEWFPFDPIEVEVQVENNGDEDNPAHDIDDLVIEIGLISSNGINVINDFEFDNRDEEEEDIGGLDPDDDDEVLFRFRLEESDDDLDGNFDFVVKVFEQGNEDQVCIDFADDLESMLGFSEDIDLERENDEERFVRFNDIEITPSQATCNEPVRIEADAVNIGDDDVEDLFVTLVNSALGIDISQRIRDDLDEGEETSILIDFIVPKDAANGNYNLILSSDYEVDDDPIPGEEDELIQLTVLGCGIGGMDDISGPVQDVAISADLISGGEAGELLVVDATVTNTGSDDGTFNLFAEGFESWATLQSVSPGTLSLDSGESKTVTITMNVNEDSSGLQAFSLQVRDASTGVLVDVREVEVAIGDVGAAGEAGFTGFADRSNLIWVIAIVNIILIVLIILVAIRLSRRQ